jgi:hypothetical protein
MPPAQRSRRELIAMAHPTHHRFDGRRAARVGPGSPAAGVRTGLTVLLAPVLIGGLLAAPGAAVTAAPTGTTEVVSGPDFNGDGYADLAVGAPGEAIGAVSGAGAVSVVYGSASGLRADGNQMWSQDSAGIAGTAERGDALGSALAVGDFDGDGYADLAAGAGHEAIGAQRSAGGVNVLYGSARGLQAGRNQFWSQDSAGIAGAAETGDAFGSALAAADLNGDGYADLAVGARQESLGADKGWAGSVNVIYGSATGLRSTGNQFWSRDSAGIAGTARPQEYFGSSLAAADVNRDGYGDLAIGVPGETLAQWPAVDYGAVNVIYGSAGGLRTVGNQYWNQNSAGVADRAEQVDAFGSAVAAADVDGDGSADLAVGVPGEYLDGGGVLEGAGAAHLLRGSTAGITAADSQFWSQNSTGVAEVAEQADSFGFALTMADLNGDGHADLAVGVPDEGVGTVVRAGGVNVLYGSASGLTATGNQFWSEAGTGIIGDPGAGDGWGRALAAGDFDGDGAADLVVGVPFEDDGAPRDSGAVTVLYGSATGLAAEGNQSWTQDSAGIAGGAESGDAFGGAVAVAG